MTVGDYERAEPLFRESLGLLRTRGDTANVARSLFNNGAVDLMLNRVAAAADRFHESLTLCRTAGDHEDSAWSLLGLAATNVATGDGERGAILLGAARAVLTQMGADFKPFERHLDEVTEERSRMLLGTAGHEAALRRGSSLTLEEALDLAAREPSDSFRAPTAGPIPALNPPAVSSTASTVIRSEVTMNHTSKKRRWLPVCLAAALLGAATILATATATAGTTACAICGKNLIKNPGADGRPRDHGRRRERRGARLDECRRRVRRSLVRLPERLVLGEIHRTEEPGQELLLRGERPGRQSRRKQRSESRRSSCPPPPIGKTATLSGWLGNYSKNTAQVRAQFEDAAGKLISAVRIGPDTTIAGTNMTARSRSAKVPAGAKQVTIVVTFAGGGPNYKLAGADALSLILR